MGYAGGINLYAYMGNNPVNKSDPLGFCGGDSGGNSLSNWYWGGMGGLSNLVSTNLLNGSDTNLGSTTGNYDAGNASAWDVAGAGAMFAGNIAVNVVPGGGEARGAEVAAHVAEISMDEAVARAASHVGGEGVMEATGKGLNYQFRNVITHANGDVEARIGRFDVNPSDIHVQSAGSHLNLETQINGKIKIKLHIGVNPLDETFS